MKPIRHLFKGEGVSHCTHSVGWTTSDSGGYVEVFCDAPLEPHRGAYLSESIERYLGDIRVLLKETGVGGWLEEYEKRNYGVNQPYELTWQRACDFDY